MAVLREISGDGESRQGNMAAQRAELLRYASRLAPSVDSAEDAVQDAYLRVIGSRAEMSSPVAYLKRTIANLLVDGARRRRREPQFVAVDDQATLVDPKPSPLRILLGRDAVREFARLLGLLPSRSQEIFMLSRVDGLTYTMIAARLGISVKAVEKHMSRAIAHFDRTAGDLL